MLVPLARSHWEDCCFLPMQSRFLFAEPFLLPVLNVCVCAHRPSNHSAKFSSKIQYVASLDELQKLIPMDCIQIPECIIR